MKQANRHYSAPRRVGRNHICMATVPVLAIATLLASSAGFAADPARGKDLAQQWCNACHSIGVDEPRNEDAGPQFAALAKRDAAYLRTAINRPHDFMPNFPRLSEADKADLIAYIQTVD